MKSIVPAIGGQEALGNPEIGLEAIPFPTASRKKP
jgi:hypothetical protein